MRRRPSARTARPLLVGLALLVLLAGPAWAEDPAPVAPPAPAPSESGPGDAGADAPAPALTDDDLERWIRDDPVAVWALVLSKYGVGLIGLVLLVLTWVRRDRVRAGVLPAAARVEPTMPFDLPQSLMVIGAAVILLVLGQTWALSLEAGGWVETALNMGVLQGVLLLLAAVVVLRRRQLQAGPRQSALATSWAAFRTFAIATACVIPVMILSVAILKALEIPITLYGPIQDVVEGKDPNVGWILLVLAVVAAPIAEESLFRGMLYPAIRNAVGPRFGVLVAAVVTSLLFAFMHAHVTSFLPLFALAMVFAVVMERTDSLATVMGAHALWNLSTMLPLLLRSAS